MSKITVNLGYTKYDVLIQRGILQNVANFFDLSNKVMIVSDDGVPYEYIQTVKKQCGDSVEYIFKTGEESKNLDVVEEILKSMLTHNFTRHDCVVAVGGGVVGDLAGFVASIYMRGIDFYNIPTTMLSQVDSSIGGKTGVNLANVKNIVGSFKQPKGVLIDTDVLKTLSRRQISNGLVEALKMGVTLDKELFEIFYNDNPFENIEKIIEKSLICKKNIVEQDEQESGLRKVLNFGHTISHGIEGTMLDGQTLFHGECVGLGMIPMCNSEVRSQIITCLQKLNVITKYDFDSKAVLNGISHDKKSLKKSTISTVFVEEIGKYEFRELNLEQIGELLTIIQDKKEQA